MKILFIGDSITEACRTKDPDFHLGYGYPLFLKADLIERFPMEDIQIINRGVSGDVIQGMHDRWQEDCLDLDADIVSILIGINDTGYNEKKDTFGTIQEFERFESIYRELLDSLKKKGTKKIVLMESFVLPFDEDRSNWRKDLDPKIKMLRKLAQEYEAIYVPLDGVLNGYCINYGYRKVTRDGVHPAPFGNKIIADTWMTFVAPYLSKLFLNHGL